MKYKYIVIFLIPTPYRKKIEDLMEIAATYSGLAKPSTKIPPHVTFHPPISNIEEPKLKEWVKDITNSICQSRLTVNSFHHFGKEYIVLPVHTTAEVSDFWSALRRTFNKLPGYKKSPFDHDNTLHISIAEKTTTFFDTMWPKLVHTGSLETMTMPFKKITIMRKETTSHNGGWGK